MASFKYYAFISYSRKDSKVAAWIQRRLEWFRFPVKLVPVDRRPPHALYLRPIYRDKTNLEVTDEHYWTNIRRALDESRYLIVLCSEHSAVSPPVDMETAYFLDGHAGDASLLVPVIVSGSVTSEGPDAAFCPALRAIGDRLLVRNLPTMVPDAITAEIDAWEQGFVSLVSYVLHLDRRAIGDHIQRETKRQTRVLRRWLTAVGMMTIIAFASAWFAFAAQRRAEAEKARAEEALVKVAASEKAATGARDKAVIARRAAEELVSYMQYDLRKTLEKAGRLSLMEAVDARIALYHEEHPPGAGDRDAERERAIALSGRASVLIAKGNLTEGLAMHDRAHTIMRNLVQSEPKDKWAQRVLAMSYSTLGDALRDQGQLGPAHNNYSLGLSMFQQLANALPGNPQAQTDLMSGLVRVGNVLYAQGDFGAALENYLKGLTIAERLVQTHPGNATRQRDLAICHERVGEAHRKLQQFDAAIASHGHSLALRRALAEAEPDNTQMQYDLAVASDRMGTTLLDQGQLGSALERFKESIVVNARLAEKDPDNAKWQIGLAINHEKIGTIARREERWAEAAAAFGQVLTLARPWLDRPDSEVLWPSIFSISAAGRWEILRDAPKGAAKLERDQVVFDLRTARDCLLQLKRNGRLVAPMNNNLPVIEGFLAKAEAEPAAKQK